MSSSPEFAPARSAVPAPERGPVLADAGPDLPDDDTAVRKVSPSQAIETAPVLVVGSGPAGMRAAQELAARGIPVTLFNAERWAPYNRVKLTPFLAGEVQIGQVYQPADSELDPKVRRYTDQRIVSIDRAAHTITGQTGRTWTYSKLILAVGSRAFVPGIPGIDLPGVFTFRKLDDVERLIARSLRSRRTLVIGGGLLGLEVARGMAARGAQTWVIENAHHLMANQLDDEAGARLARQVTSPGFTIRTRVGVKEITGRGRVERALLTNGESVECDTIIVCTGIRSNIGLARDARLAVGRGISVNAHMQTSDPDIYAIGECAEFNGNVYGLVSPGLEQAATAVAHIAEEDVVYGGSVPTTRLKVVGVEVCSVGDVEQLDQRSDLTTRSWQDTETDAYRRLVFHRGRLVGALGIGPWADFNRIQQAVEARARTWFWQRQRFSRKGVLWARQPPASVLAWPEVATVCNCTGVTRGQLGRAIVKGADNIEALRRATSAATVCGSCQPLLSELLGTPTVREPVAWTKGLAWASAIALLAAAVAALLPAWSYSASVQERLQIDQLWIDGGWKQVSGFTLLGLSIVAGLISVRKRTRRNLLGGYDGWRIFHTALGAALLGVLFVHTGFNLGHNLNFWLMSSFLVVTLLGAGAGLVTALEHKIADGTFKRFRTPPRRISTWFHLLATWPLPALLIIHILTVYFY